LPNYFGHLFNIYHLLMWVVVVDDDNDDDDVKCLLLARQFEEVDTA